MEEISNSAFAKCTFNFKGTVYLGSICVKVENK